MSFTLDTEQKRTLLRLARQVVETHVAGGEPAFSCDDPILSTPAAVFVTLKIAGELRGCIGQTEAYEPMWCAVMRMARAAAFDDPRFAPVTREELPALRYEITVLTPLEDVRDPAEIVVGRDGLMLSRGGRRGLLLPQVATEWGFDRETFLCQTARKAGLPGDSWRDGSVRIQRFQGLVFGEGDVAEG